MSKRMLLPSVHFRFLDVFAACRCGSLSARGREVAATIPGPLTALVCIATGRRGRGLLWLGDIPRCASSLLLLCTQGNGNCVVTEDPGRISRTAQEVVFGGDPLHFTDARHARCRRLWRWASYWRRAFPTGRASATIKMKRLA